MSEQAKPKAPVKSARRRAREFVVQGLYQWQLTQESVGSIERFLKEGNTSFVRADQDLFRAIFFGAVKDVEKLTVALAPHVDRPFVEISPVRLLLYTLIAGLPLTAPKAFPVMFVTRLLFPTRIPPALQFFTMLFAIS